MGIGYTLPPFNVRSVSDILWRNLRAKTSIDCNVDSSTRLAQNNTQVEKLNLHSIPTKAVRAYDASPSSTVINICLGSKK